MRGLQAVIELSAEEREELKRWSNSRTLPSGDVFKARLVLALADGISYSRIETELNTSRPTIRLSSSIRIDALFSISVNGGWSSIQSLASVLPRSIRP